MRNFKFLLLLITIILFFHTSIAYSGLKPYDGSDFDQISSRLKEFKTGIPGSGFVQSKPDKLNKLTENLVEKGIGYIEKFGLENTILLINEKPRKFRDFKTYLFIIDLNGNVLAHSGNPNFAGENMLYTKNSRGHLFIQEYIDYISQYGGINYINLLTLDDNTQYIYNFVCLEVLEDNIIIGAVAKP